MLDQKIKSRPELSDKEIITTEPQDLRVNDTFLISYGSDYNRFRVHKVYVDGVLAHSMKWLKSSSLFLSHTELRERRFSYYNRISKLRAFFMW